MNSQRQSLFGDIALTQPLSDSLLTTFLCTIVVAIAVFVSLGSYARKESVAGYLTPDTGIVNIHAQRPGVVGKLHAMEGDVVNKGAPLLTLVTDRVTSSGELADEVVLGSIHTQLAEVKVQEALEYERRDAEVARLQAELKGLESETLAIASMLKTQSRFIRSQEKNYQRILELADQGYVSEDDRMNREQSMLGSKQKLSTLVQQKLTNERRTEQVRLRLQTIPIESSQKLSALVSSRAGLQRQKAELKTRQSLAVVAPITGTVTALRAIAGSSVDSTHPLLTILPEGSVLQAHLYLPTRAIGFVAKGQDVRLLYDAFDYRRYGFQTGVVAAISSSVFLPDEQPSGLRLGEPSYRVTVNLDQQFMNAKGQELPLQVGMLLRANIVLEDRSLIQWLLAPLYSLRK